MKLDIYEWAILRAMLLHNKELAKSLLKESRVVNNNPADVPLFGRGQRRLFELYEDLIDEVPTARRQLQSDAADELSKKIGNELMGMEVWHAAEFRVMRYALLHVDTKAGVEMWSRSIRKALNEADQQYIQHNAVLRRRVINVTNSTWHQYNWQHVNPLGYDAMARSMEKLYEETHLRKDLEAYFEFKSLDGLFVRRNWLQ
ncbi:hypothetical protein H7R52_02070 [Weissella confusa]|uniref:Uncharacterized protein n=1 Tax=Weissella confusa TaxID=1583 RepID=A0A923SSQ2_WEICO|nr:hypothetical protein [Weissella confusa]